MAKQKKILITGAGSFVGTSVQKYLQHWPEKYNVVTVGTRNGEWKKLDFSIFDTVYHVAGIAHSDVGNVTDDIKKMYYAVNTDLTIKIAKKAKSEGVRQFIFMSTAIVYGDSAPIGKSKIITKDTPCNPSNFYGDSKVQAEKGIFPLANENFKVVILRCPMIYGNGGKGNFLTLKKIALSVPFFPKVDNKRSMLYIGNLAEFVRLMVENDENGIFCPCNREISNTSELVKMLATNHKKNVLLLPGFSPLLKILAHFTGYVNKAFGNLTYDEKLSNYKENYRLYSLAQSIREIKE